MSSFVLCFKGIQVSIGMVKRRESAAIRIIVKLEFFALIFDYVKAERNDKRGEISEVFHDD